jgi:hypothetical protein
MNHYSSGRKLLLPFFLAGSMLLAAQSTAPHKTSDTVKVDPNGPLATLETKAAALDPKNLQTVGDLYDHIFSRESIMPISQNAVASMRSQFINIEAAYWQGTGPGVTEQNILDAYNNGVTTLGLRREYLATLTQVQRVRRVFVFFSPVFIGTRFAAADPTTKKRSVNPSMSPLQAVLIFRGLVDSKLRLKQYQVTPEEWEANLKADPLSGTMASALNFGPRAYIEPLRREFFNALGQLSETAQLQLWLKTLSYFGVN